MFTRNPLESSRALSSQVAQSTEQAIQSTQRMAHEALDNLADTVQDASHQVRSQARQASRSTVRYIRDEPVKAMLIAAASGAALMALINLVGHSRQHR